MGDILKFGFEILFVGFFQELDTVIDHSGFG